MEHSLRISHRSSMRISSDGHQTNPNLKWGHENLHVLQFMCESFDYKTTQKVNRGSAVYTVGGIMWVTSTDSFIFQRIIITKFGRCRRRNSRNRFLSLDWLWTKMEHLKAPFLGIWVHLTSNPPTLVNQIPVCRWNVKGEYAIISDNIVEVFIFGI